MSRDGVQVLSILGRDYSIRVPAGEERALADAAAFGGAVGALGDGTIIQMVPLSTMCRHTVGLNYTAIGIEPLIRALARKGK